MSEEIAQLIAELPKSELHLHIEGTFEPELRFEIAKRNGIKLPWNTPEEVRAAYDFNDLTSFLVGYYDAMKVLLHEPDFYDLAMAYFRRAAAENIRWVEVFFDPQAHTSRGVEFSTVIRGLRRAQLDAQKQLGVQSGLIMCFLRDFEAEYAMATLLESLPYKDWILGVGLDSDERDNPPAKFARVFARARQEGYFLTMHCDIDQNNSIEHIRQAITEIGVQRIDHGTNILEDPALVELVREKGIGLTCCPVSNSWVTKAFGVGSSKADLMMELMNKGVMVCFNSDDPAYFGGYINANYELVAKEQGLSAEQLIAVARNSFNISWAPENVKREAFAKLDELSAKYCK